MSDTELRAAAMALLAARKTANFVSAECHYYALASPSVVVALLDRVEKLKKWIRDEAGHNGACPRAEYGPRKTCDCGLTDLLKETTP